MDVDAMRKLLLALALVLAPSIAFAQCNGVFPPHTLCGNLSASPALPGPVSSSGSVIGPVTSVVGDLAVWANVTGTQLADSNVLPNGTIATTQASLDATTKVATTAYVQGTSFTGLTLQLNATNISGPILNWIGLNGQWQTALDTANAPGNSDLVLAAKRTGNSVGDFVYIANNQNGIYTINSITAAGTGYSIGDTLTLSGGTSTSSGTLLVSTTGGGGSVTAVTRSAAGTYTVLPNSCSYNVACAGVAVTGGGGSNATFNITFLANPPTAGIGVTPPDLTYSLHVSAPDAFPGMGTMRLRISQNQTAPSIAIISSAGGAPLWSVVPSGSGIYQSPTFFQDNATPTVINGYCNSAATTCYGWAFSGTSMVFKETVGATSFITYNKTTPKMSFGTAVESTAYIYTTSYVDSVLGYKTNSVAGVSCTGALTASSVSVSLGIITHC